MKTEMLKLSMKDVAKSVILVVITALLTTIGKMIEAMDFPSTWEDWKVVLIASVGAGVSYLLKNFLTNSDDQFLKKEEARYPYN